MLGPVMIRNSFSPDRGKQMLTVRIGNGHKVEDKIERNHANNPFRAKDTVMYFQKLC